MNDMCDRFTAARHALSYFIMLSYVLCSTFFICLTEMTGEIALRAAEMLANMEASSAGVNSSCHSEGAPPRSSMYGLSPERIRNSENVRARDTSDIVYVDT